MLFKRFIPFSIQALRLLFSRPGALLHFAKNLTKGPDSAISDSAQYGELLSIAVDPTIQGKGVGKALLTAIEEILLKRGQYENSLTTDAVANDKTISFYRKNGYEVFYQFTAYPNRCMLRMNKRLSKIGN
jgi:ribosomal protein S18 acetylase RimI-like enzyme